MENRISGKTKLACLLGSPVSHSMSPYLHNAWFEQTGQDCVYLCFDTPGDKLGETVSAMRRLNVLGFNVTMPNKTDVMRYLDVISDEARLIGSVNTVKCLDGKLYGYNTDGAGFVKSLTDAGIEYKAKNVTVCGAGGAGKAVCAALALNGVKCLNIFDVNDIASKSLAQVISSETSVSANAVPFNRDVLAAYARDCEIFINCTAVGMSPNADDVPVDTSAFGTGSIVVDCIYEPNPTRMLREASAKGATVLSGVGMLRNQAALAFQLWTGVKVQ